MNEQELIATIEDLIAIPSTADNPGAIRDAYTYMYDLIRRSGKDFTIEPFESNGIPSFLAYRGTVRPERFHLILNGHVDVVSGKPEQFQPRVENGKLYGRGAYDMKAAAVVLADVFCEFVDKVPYALGLQIVCDEENAGIHGTQYQIQEGVRTDFVVCGDCGRAPGTYEIANEAKGICAFAVKFAGTPAHGAYPWHGENAGLKAVHFAHRMNEQFPTPQIATDQTTVSLTAIVSHGNGYSQTPADATARFDVRYVTNDPHFSSKEAVAQLVHEIDPEAEITEFLAYSAPINTSPSNPLLLSLKAAAEEVEHHEFSLVRRNGTSDGRHYGEVGDEACEFGVIGVGQHGDNEFVTLEDCFKYQATMREFLAKTIETERHFDEIAPTISVDQNTIV